MLRTVTPTHGLCQVAERHSLRNVTPRAGGWTELRPHGLDDRLVSAARSHASAWNRVSIAQAAAMWRTG